MNKINSQLRRERERIRIYNLIALHDISMQISCANEYKLDGLQNTSSWKNSRKTFHKNNIPLNANVS